jgi:DedD protein
VTKKMQRYQEGGGFSAWQLVLIFLGGVAVCAVFFSLGFVVGYNHQSSKLATATESVTAPANPDIPPTINSPLASSSEMTNETVTPEAVPPSSITQPEESASQPLTPPPAKPVSHAARKSAEKSSARSALERKPPHQKETQPAAVAAVSPKGHFSVQVMASKTKADAMNLIRLLETRKYHAFLVPPKSGHAGDSLYRVQVGPFASRPEAESARHKLASEGFKPFIVH